MIKPKTEVDKKKEIDLLEKAFSSGSTMNLHEKMMSKELFNKSDIDQKTRLSSNEIMIVVRGHFIADFLREKCYDRFADKLDKFYNDIKEHRPSLEGKSREEFTNVLGREVSNAVEEKKGLKLQ